MTVSGQRNLKLVQTQVRYGGNSALRGATPCFGESEKFGFHEFGSDPDISKIMFTFRDEANKTVQMTFREAGDDWVLYGNDSSNSGNFVFLPIPEGEKIPHTDRVVPRAVVPSGSYVGHEVDLPFVPRWLTLAEIQTVTPSWEVEIHSCEDIRKIFQRMSEDSGLTRVMFVFSDPQGNALNLVLKREKGAWIAFALDTVSGNSVVLMQNFVDYSLMI